MHIFEAVLTIIFGFVLVVYIVGLLFPMSFMWFIDELADWYYAIKEKVLGKKE